MLLLAVLPFLSLAVGTAGANNRAVVNDYLEQVMATWPSDQPIEVLVRFSSEVNTYDLGHLELAGLEPRHTFHAIPAVWAIGSPAAVYRASLDPRVAWIEWNRPLQFMMENSSYTINATRAWNAVVEDQSRQFSEIDGKGVTVVVVDSGVDAGHPDLDYGSKTLMNLKSDSNLGWYELENSDTSSGHGTHVAGTVAGNGDVSAGGRRGVAPGANLIALSTGEAVAILNALGALEWVYDHSRPGNNPFNIRCATNSWGTSGAPYDPNDSIAIITEKLTYENNVVVTFAAGNAGGDGSEIRTNPYANTPAAISVAAFTRDGTGVTGFSSRGLAADNATWPDIGAPGLRIESTRARMTLITAEVCISGGQCDPYYMAISGTSMATPHVAGEVALLFQAAPSLRVSDYHADFGSQENTSAEDLQNWFTNPRTRMHEVEVILKVTAHHLTNGTNSDGNDNGIPWDNGTTGIWGLPNDFVQGYGLTDMNQAIALALALQKLRSQHPEATVWDAYVQWKGLKIAKDLEFEGKTDTLVTGWTGEYTRYNDQFGRPLLVQNSTKWVFIPNGTTEVTLDLTYVMVAVDELAIGSVSYMIDFQDGSPPIQGPLLGGGGQRTRTLSSSEISEKTGAVWAFSVIGVGVRVQDRLPPYQFKELRLPYTYGLTIKMATSPDTPTVLEFHDTHAMFAQWRFLDNGTTGNGSIIMTRPVFDLTQVRWTGGGPQVPGGGGELPWWAVVLGLLIALGVGLWLYSEQRVRSGKAPVAAVVKAKELFKRARSGSIREVLKPGSFKERARGLVGKVTAAARRPTAAIKALRQRLPFRRPG